MLPIKHILAAIDWSEASMRAFQVAVSLAREHDAQLILVHVVRFPAIMYGPAPDNYLEHLREELCRLDPADQQTRVRHLVVEGDPAREILTAARDNHCDMIVMGTHGRCGLNRLLLGSVAEEVVRKAPCLVLTVKNALPAELSGQATTVKESEKSSGCLGTTKTTAS